MGALVHLTRRELQSKCKEIQTYDSTVRCNGTNIELIRIVESHATAPSNFKSKAGNKSKRSVKDAKNAPSNLKPKAGIASKRTVKDAKNARILSLEACLRDLNSNTEMLTPTQGKACLALIETECITLTVLPTHADKECAKQRTGSKAIGLHGGKLCCASVGKENPLQSSIRILTLCLHYLERTVGIKLQELVLKLRKAAKTPLEAIRQLITTLIHSLKLGWKTLASPRTYGLLSIAICILSVGWTASAFGDWASSWHGHVSVSADAFNASGAFDGNAAAAFARAAESTAATNKIVAGTAMVGHLGSLLNTYVMTNTDMAMLKSLQVAAKTLLRPGVSDATVYGILLFTTMLQNPVAMSATKDAATAVVKNAASATSAATATVKNAASAASVVTSALYTGAGQTGYALTWFVWNVLITSE